MAQGGVVSAACCRGVGLHHGGLLPVLRELTEKLFKERSAAYFDVF